MTITWEQVLAFLCEDQTMAITSLLFLAFFAAVALLNYTLPRVLRPYCLLAASYLFYCWGANDRLRHFYATYLLQEGTSKQVAASLLGHADTAFLERTYCHPQDAVKLQAANLMQDLLNSQNPCYVAFMKNKNRKAKKAG